MEAAGAAETLVRVCRNAWHLHIHCCTNLNSHYLQFQSQDILCVEAHFAHIVPGVLISP